MLKERNNPMKKTFFLAGTITFTAIGAYIEDFISELIETGIPVRNIRNEKGVIYADSCRIYYQTIAKTAKKHRIKTKINKRSGMYYKFKKTKTHAGVLLGVIAAAFILLVLQRFIWKIEVHGVNNVSENLILEIVSDNGISLGELTSNMDAEGAEIRLKSMLKDVSWVNIELSGSKADVYILETDSIVKSDIPLKTPCNVIAGKTGVIIDTEIYSGTLMYPKGSGVSKGNVIVSGIVNDGADNILMTHANAKIIADFKETAEFRQEFTTIEKEKIGNDIIEKELMLFGFVFPITDKVEISDNMVCKEQLENCSIKNFVLPWKIKKNTYTTYKDIKVSRSPQDAMKLLEQQLNSYCNNFYSDYEILDIIKTIKSDENGITLIAEFQLRGDIAVLQEIM